MAFILGPIALRRWERRERPTGTKRATLTRWTRHAMPVLLVGLFSGAMTMLGSAIGGAAAQSTPVSDAFDSAPEPTALLVTATNDPFEVPATDGMVHLEYDLIIGNVFPAPVILSAVEVVTPDGNSLRR